jgi:hypothetical protein
LVIVLIRKWLQPSGFTHSVERTQGTLERLYHDFGGDGDLTVTEYQAMGGMAQIVQTEVDSLLVATSYGLRRGCRHGAVTIPVIAVGGLVPVGLRQEGTDVNLARCTLLLRRYRVTPVVVAWVNRVPGGGRRAIIR